MFTAMNVVKACSRQRAEWKETDEKNGVPSPLGVGEQMT